MIIQRGTLVRLKKQGGPIHHSFMVSNAFSLGSATNKQCKRCQRFSCQVVFKWCMFLDGLYSWQSSTLFSILLVIAVKQFSFIIPKKVHLMMIMKTRMMMMTMMMMMLAQLNLVLFRLNGFIVFIP